MKRRDDGNPLERMLQRFAKFAQGGPTVPWLPQDANISALRRTVDRLRSGEMKTPPGIDPKIAAWMIERGIEQRAVVAETIADMDAAPGDDGSRKERKRSLRRRAEFHRLKIAARDPQSGAVEKFRQKNRARRKELGRPGQRRGDESQARPRRQIRLPLTFVVGNAQHVFLDPYGADVDEALEAWFPEQFRRSEDEDPWCSAAVEWCGWGDLQKRVVAALGREAVPHLLHTAANKGVFLPGNVEPCGLTELDADPSAKLAIGSVGSLIEELERFAARSGLPIDDAALMALPAKLDEYDFALQTYAQVLRAAHYARTTRIPLWAVANTWPIE